MPKLAPLRTPTSTFPLAAPYRQPIKPSRRDPQMVPVIFAGSVAAFATTVAAFENPAFKSSFQSEFEMKSPLEDT